MKKNSKTNIGAVAKNILSKSEAAMEQEELEEIASRAEDFESNKALAKGLKSVLEDLGWLVKLLGDSVSGRYPENWKVIAKIGACVAYAISPIDAIPDVLPVIGWTDDAMVIAWCVAALKPNIDAYRMWKQAALA